MRALILASILYVCSGFASNYTLSVAAIFQDEAPYMQEWLEYHRSHGVEHFWLYNNCSTDNYKEVLDSWIADGTVELINWGSPDERTDGPYFVFYRQIGAYNDALNRARGVSKWLALIDIDEFIICADHGNIARFLEKSYAYCSGLMINWQCYGTGGSWNSPSMLRDVKYKMAEQHEWNRNCKSVVQPLHVLNCPNPHFCNYLLTHWAVNSDYQRCEAQSPTVNISKIRINHYWARDEKYLTEKKIPRGVRWGDNEKAIRERAASMNVQYDPYVE